VNSKTTKSPARSDAYSNEFAAPPSQAPAQAPNASNEMWFREKLYFFLIEYFFEDILPHSKPLAINRHDNENPGTNIRPQQPYFYTSAGREMESARLSRRY
jgi:hypothetical protein